MNKKLFLVLLTSFITLSLSASHSEKNYESYGSVDSQSPMQSVLHHAQEKRVKIQKQEESFTYESDGSVNSQSSKTSTTTIGKKNNKNNKNNKNKKGFTNVYSIKNKKRILCHEVGKMSDEQLDEYYKKLDEYENSISTAIEKLRSLSNCIS